MQKDKRPKWIKESPKISPSYFVDGIYRFLEIAAVRQGNCPEPEVSMNTANPGLKIIYAVQSIISEPHGKCEQRVLEVNWHFTCSLM